MNELMIVTRGQVNLRHRLLMDVSAIALLSLLVTTNAVLAEDQADQPTVWIELGGQLSDLGGGQEALAPSFVPSLAQYGVLSPVRVQSRPHYSLEADGKLSFQPAGDDWVFSASVRYGRSASEKKQHQQTPNAKVPVDFSAFGFQIGPKYHYPSSHVKFADASAKESERYLVLDFQAGKDVGLGIFGAHGSSTLSAGVRIAQFTSQSHVNMHLEPDLQYPAAPITNITEFRNFRSYETIRFHDYAAGADFSRSFQGIGPSIAWDASMPVAGNTDAGELAVNWGLNAAVLFGRQKVSGHHQTATNTYVMTRYVSAGCTGYKRAFVQGFCTGSVARHNQPPADRNRVRSVVIPNLGGSIGFSYRIEDFKLNVGYRADFFLGAMDGGLDARKSYDRNFYGPYATISIGLGG